MTTLSLSLSLFVAYSAAQNQLTPHYGDDMLHGSASAATSVAGTPAYDPSDRPLSRSSRESSYPLGKSPGGRSSVRGTPHTNTSPRSMQLGDATPLYDEN